MMSLLGNRGKLQEEMGKFQEAVGKITATGEAGGGLVSVTANGKLEVVGCKLSADALKLNDPEMLEDLIVAACNQAMGKVREQLAAETNKVAAAVGIPPGMLGGGGLPGFGG
jgi:DNA-binding YbaB/EbfC family protein